MAYAHVAHDCVVGNQCVLANCATLGGHVELGDWVIMGGFAAIHQFCKVGAHAFLANNAAVTRDVPPYVMAIGQPATPHSVNAEGLKRRGFTRVQIRNIRNAYRVLYRSGLKLADAEAQLKAIGARAAGDPGVRRIHPAVDAQPRALSARDRSCRLRSRIARRSVSSPARRRGHLGAVADRARCGNVRPARVSSASPGHDGRRRLRALVPVRRARGHGPRRDPRSTCRGCCGCARTRRAAARSAPGRLRRHRRAGVQPACSPRSLKAHGVPHRAVREPAGLGVAAGARAHASRRAVDLVLCLLPFESRFYDAARRARRVRRASARRPRCRCESTAAAARARARHRRARADRRAAAGQPRAARWAGSARRFAATARWLRARRPERASSSRRWRTRAPGRSSRAALARLRRRRRCGCSTGRRRKRAGGGRCGARRLGHRDARDGAVQAPDGRRLPPRAR